MNVVVVGAGYVGLSLAVLLARRHPVVLVDVDAAKVSTIETGHSPVNDRDIAAALTDPQVTRNLRATLGDCSAYALADVVVIATPTDFDSEQQQFDTASVRAVAERVIECNPETTIVVKSTVPVGFTDRLKKDLKAKHLFFSPEFLREGKALHDNLYPSRIVVGERSERGQRFAELLREASCDPQAPIVLTGNAEAEAIKLFSNAYLAMRVAFFNELDTFAAASGLDTRQIIEGTGLDLRIGEHYNNPSFGYGGYCLPKDTQQLLAQYEGVPQRLIGAIVEANEQRKAFIAQDILKRRPRTVGIYRLVMKSGSDNYRAAAVRGVMEHLRVEGVEMIIYEPTLQSAEYANATVIKDLADFKSRSDIIVANRNSNDLEDVAEKLYTRDVFGSDA